VRSVKAAIFTAAILGLGFSATSSFAAADDAIKGRQGCMKAHGASLEVMVPMMKGEKPYDNAAIQAILAKEETACADWDKWWGADTQKGETVETYAKPEIWTDTKGFTDAGGKWFEAYKAVKASADEAAFKAAFPVLGEACKGCHDKFRRPKDN
jgi:cytochrome c556